MKTQRRVVYITGVTGNIGRVLAQGLAGEYELRGNSRSGDPVEGVRVAKGNITDGEFMRRELEGVDTVIHLAGDASPRASWQSVLENNIDGTYQVYEAARLAGVRRIIFASTNHVTGILTERAVEIDRKSTRLNSSHVKISY